MKIAINVPAFAGTYELDRATFTGHDLHLIKQVAGVRGGEIEEAAEKGDYDLLVAFAVIALIKSGKVPARDAHEVARVILDANPADAIAVPDTPEEADEEGPPAEAPTVPDESDRQSASGERSSPSSSNGSADPQATTLASIGAQT